MNLFKYKAVIVFSIVTFLISLNILENRYSTELVYLVYISAGNIFFSCIILQIAFDGGHVYMDKRHRNAHVLWYSFLICMALLFIRTGTTPFMIGIISMGILKCIIGILKEVSGEKTRIRRTKRWESKINSKKQSLS